jgi:dTDP-4-amino-4,6-dideoxygalactose transaminase
VTAAPRETESEVRLNGGRRSSFLPFSPPDISEDEIADVIATLREGWITTGPRVKRFEEAFAAAVGAPGALAVNCCTGAMHIALAALGIGSGDAVFLPTMTFCATANVVEHQGALPVLVDVEPDTLNLSPSALEAAIEALPRSFAGRAVLPVHYGGHPVDMSAILSLAETHRLAVVEDAAHALPASIGDVTVGAVPEGAVLRAVAFSFYATKNLTTGEGGMLTATPDLLEEARLWCLHGMSRDAWKRYGEKGSWYYEVVRPGFKYNMTDIAAAIGLRQLERLPALHRRRAALVGRYRDGLAGLEAVEVPIERPGMTSAWHLFVVRLELDRLLIDRDRFIDELTARNIGSSVHFIPVHHHPYYRQRYGYKIGDFPVADREFDRIVSLPLNTTMSDADVDSVVAAVRDIAEIFSA